MGESANERAGIVAAATAECQRVRWSGTAPQMSRPNTSFDSSRPRVVRTTRSLSVTVSSPAASAHPKTSASGGSCVVASGTPVSSRRPRISDSAVAVSTPRRSTPPGGRLGGDAAERCDVEIDAGSCPSPIRPVERVRARSQGLVRLPLPVREVVAALVTGLGPIRDLVAAIAGLFEQQRRVVVLAGGPVLVLAGSDGVAPATCALGGGQVIAHRSGQALGHGVVERQGVERQVVGLELQRAYRGWPSRSTDRCRGCRRAGRR